MTTANSLAQINAAIQACPSGQVVYLAAGTYNIGQITFGYKSGVTLRGAGAGKTVIYPSVSSQAITNSYPSYSEAAGISVASGYTRGSTTITLASSPTSHFIVGSLLVISEDASPDKWDTGIGTYYRTGLTSNLYNLTSTRVFHFTSRITAVNGNNITIAAPIPLDFSASLGVKAYAPTSDGCTSLCGVEDLTIDGHDVCYEVVLFAGADRCWLKNVEAKNSGGSIGIVRLNRCAQFELRKCFIRDTTGYPANSDGYGTVFYYGTSNSLMVDCIVNKVACLNMSNGAAGNAFVYNYARDTCRASVFGRGVQINHGPHGFMELIEGNILPTVVNDGYHGSASHTIVFRNSVNGLNSTQTLQRKLLNLCRGSYYHSVVGNILGDSSWDPLYYDQPYPVSYIGAIYALGWPGADSLDLGGYTSVPWTGWAKSTSVPDADVYGTLVRHANYDYYNDDVIYIDGEDTDIQDSLFYDSKPDYFGGLLWPPIGPDVSGYVTDIPARWRWDRYVITGNLDDIFTDDIGEITGFVNRETVFLTVSEDEVAKLYVEIPKKRAVVGTSVVYNVHAEPWHDFVGDITLDVTGLPTNATDAYGQNPIAYNGNTTVTVTTTDVSAGTYSMYITGTSEGGDVASVRVVLEITESADADIKVPFRRIRAKQGDNAVFTIQADALSGYTDNVDLSVSGVPTGATSEFGATPIAYNGSTTLTVDTGTAAVGEHELIITGEGPA